MFFDTPLNHRIWYKIMVLAIIIIMGYLVIQKWWETTKNKFEGMTDGSMSLSNIQGSDKFKLVEAPYSDPYYVAIYDHLHLPHRRLPEEIDWILTSTHANPSTAVIVDVGCGTCTGVAALLEKGYSNSYGIDASPAMIEKGTQTHPAVATHCVSENVLTSPMLFERESLTHVLCLGKTIYEFDDKRTFFKHCYNWLKPGGILALHLVEPDTYNPYPLLSYKNSIFQYDSPKHAERPKHEERPVELAEDVTCKTSVQSDGMLVETFACAGTGHMRQMERRMYMEHPDEIIGQAQMCGFMPTPMKTNMPEEDPHQQIVLLKRTL
jgi:SAM-dependent methyltransferase